LAIEAAGARCDRDQPVRALFDRLAGEAVVDDVVQRDPAPRMHRLVQLLARAERGDDDRHLPLGAGRHILFEPGVRPVHDLVDRKGCRGRIRVGAVVIGKRFADLVQPFVELALRPRVQRREAPHHAGLALGDHQRRVRHDEQGRADDRQSERREDGRQ
jgi:hypothetical protein